MLSATFKCFLAGDPSSTDEENSWPGIYAGLSQHYERLHVFSKRPQTRIHRCVSGILCRTSSSVASLLVIYGMLVAGSSTVTGHDAVSLFDGRIETPFLEPVITDDSANTSGTTTSMDPIEDRFLQMQQELDELKASLDVNDKKTDAAKTAADKALKPAPITYPTAKLTGFFQMDAGWFRQDAPSTAQLGDIQDDRGFRRTRLAAVGKVAENVSYMLEMDFAFVGRPSFMDVWMNVSKVPLFGNVRVGQYRMPFGMDELTSVKELTFLERPLTQPMGPFRQIGIGLHDNTDDENITWAASAFGSATDAFGNSIGDRGYGLASRITAVVAEDNSADFLVHTGFGYSYIATPNSTVQYRHTPEYAGQFTGAIGDVPFFTDSGLLPAENANLLNGELASTWGSWHAQSELRYNIVNLDNGGDAGFPSFYAQSGYILTGEHRTYNKAGGVLGRVKPKCPVGIKGGGIGAWELACRYSLVDLSDGAIRGGSLHDMTCGLNWYLNDFTKFQFNYIQADLNRTPTGDSRTDIFAVRAQLDF